MQSFARTLAPIILFLAGIGAGSEAAAQDLQGGDPSRGQIYFQQSCAICHTTTLGPNNSVIVKQGPSLVGIIGRRAGTGLSFNYTKAMADSGLTWDAATLDRFLTNPMQVVPGTPMPMPVPDADNRHNVIAYLATLTIPQGVTLTASVTPATNSLPTTDPGDWRNAAPGVKHHITVADLPKPYATTSSGNNPRVIRQPAEAVLSVPPGFTVRLFASGLSNPRLLRVAPNGDIFIAETRARPHPGDARRRWGGRPVRKSDFCQRAWTGRSASPSIQWAIIRSGFTWRTIIRWSASPIITAISRRNGDAQVIVPHLTDSNGGHSTRDVAFSRDGKRMFISVGSGSNVAENMSKKNPDEMQAWEAEHGRGAAWDAEANRADILVTDPEGKQPLHTFATGIRNGVGMAVNPDTGELWVSTNERDALGDDLVPDYITRVKGGRILWLALVLHGQH